MGRSAAGTQLWPMKPASRVKGRSWAIITALAQCLPWTAMHMQATKGSQLIRGVVIGQLQQQFLSLSISGLTGSALHQYVG